MNGSNGNGSRFSAKTWVPVSLVITLSAGIWFAASTHQRVLGELEDCHEKIAVLESRYAAHIQEVRQIEKELRRELAGAQAERLGWEKRLMGIRDSAHTATSRADRALRDIGIHEGVYHR